MCVLVLVNKSARVYFLTCAKRIGVLDTNFPLGKNKTTQKEALLTLPNHT